MLAVYEFVYFAEEEKNFRFISALMWNLYYACAEPATSELPVQIVSPPWNLATPISYV